MATTVFAATDTYFTTGGLLATAATFVGRSARQFTGWNCQLEFSVVGTECLLTAFHGSDGTAVDVTIDGGSASTLTPNDAWGNYTLFTGLADTTHTVKVRITNIAKAYFYLDAASAITVTGTTPAIGITSGLAQAMNVQNSTFRASAQLEGGWVNFNVAGIVGLNTSNTLSVIRFRAQCSSIRIYSYAQAQNGWILRVDGETLSSANIKVPNNTSTFEWLTLATGLDAGATHEYEIINTTQSGAWYLQNIQCAGGTGTGQVTHTFTERDVYVAIGTSITEGYNEAENHDFKGYAWLVAQSKNWAIWNVGLNSSTVVANMATRIGLASSATAAKVVAITDEYGTNDDPSSDQTTYRTTLETQYAALLSSYVNARVCSLGVLPNQRNSTTQGTYSTLKQTAVANVNNSRLFFVDTGRHGGVAWIDTTIGSDLADSVHPSTQGHVKIAAKIVTFVNLPNSAFDAAGNIKTLAAGKHGNPYSLLVRNPWSTPELANIGIPSSNKIAPSVDVQAASVVDTQFNRILANGTDRYLAYRQALTGADKTNTEGYTT